VRLIHKICRGLMRCYPFARGRGFILLRTPLRRLRFDEETLVVRCKRGLSLRILPNDYIGRCLYLTGQFVDEIQQLLVEISLPDDRVLDIGANIGLVSCTLLRVNPSCRIVAVEPQPR